RRVINLVNELENLSRMLVAFCAETTGILVRDVPAAGFDLPDTVTDSFQQIDRFEASDDDRHAKTFCKPGVRFEAGDRTDMPGSHDPVNRIVRRLHQRYHCRLYAHMRNQHG